MTGWKMTKITEAMFLEAVDGYEGWCPECEEFTRNCTEPDAQGYDCPNCDGMNVIGAELALLSGKIEF